jgi:hypothetical protein
MNDLLKLIDDVNNKIVKKEKNKKKIDLQEYRFNSIDLYLQTRSRLIQEQFNNFFLLYKNYTIMIGGGLVNSKNILPKLDIDE